MKTFALIMSLAGNPIFPDDKPFFFDTRADCELALSLIAGSFSTGFHGECRDKITGQLLAVQDNS